jgi:hypothetical protein
VDRVKSNNFREKLFLTLCYLLLSYLSELIQRFTQQNQMEYFDADYSEEIAKNV